VSGAVDVLSDLSITPPYRRNPQTSRGPCICIRLRDQGAGRKRHSPHQSHLLHLLPPSSYVQYRLRPSRVLPSYSDTFHSINAHRDLTTPHLALVARDKSATFATIGVTIDSYGSNTVPAVMSDICLYVHFIRQPLFSSLLV